MAIVQSFRHTPPIHIKISKFLIIFKGYKVIANQYEFQLNFLFRTIENTGPKDLVN